MKCKIYAPESQNNLIRGLDLKWNNPEYSVTLILEILACWVNKWICENPELTLFHTNNSDTLTSSLGLDSSVSGDHLLSH